MPQRLKRRSEAISRNASEAENDSDQQQARQRQRQRRDASPTADTAANSPAVPSDAESENDNDNDNLAGEEDLTNDSQTHHKTMVKKLVRLALSAEYSRQPIRRTDINAKILKNANAGGSGGGSRSTFRTIFTSAQQTLRDVFGMEMVDLPSRERTGIAERRKAASQKATQRETQAARARDEETVNGNGTGTQSQRGKDPLLSAQSWILVSTLPEAYRVHPTLLLPPARAPDSATEAAYTALYSLIVSLIYLHAPSGNSSTQRPNGEVVAAGEDSTEPLSDAKLHRWLSRLDLDSYVPAPVDMTLEKALARMIREGYVERRRDTSSGEEVVEWVVGPRGKKEVGRTGVAKLVRGVYGFGVDGKGEGQQHVQEREVEENGRGNEEEENEEGGERERVQRRRPVKMDRDELERRLQRTLGAVVKIEIRAQEREEDSRGQEDGVDEGDEEGQSRRRNADGNGNSRETSSRATARRPTRRRGRDDEEEEDEDEG